MTTKRTYRRRSDDERIADLEGKIHELQKKLESKARPDLPVIKEIPKVQSRLRKFAQTAMNYGRNDLANSTMAFVAGLDRTLHEAGAGRPAEDVSTADQGD